MVGPVISCEGAPFKGKGEDAWSHSPAVQSYAVALDQVRFSCRPRGLPDPEEIPLPTSSKLRSGQQLARWPCILLY